MAPWTIARWIGDVGGGWPRPGGVAVVGLLRTLIAFSFQVRTMSSVASAEADAVVNASRLPATVSAVMAASQRRARLRVADGSIVSLPAGGGRPARRCGRRTRRVGTATGVKPASTH